MEEMAISHSDFIRTAGAYSAAAARTCGGGACTTGAAAARAARKRHRDAGQIGFVIAHADAVIGVPVDQRDLEVLRRAAKLGALARSAHRRPQACEPSAQHHDPLHYVSPGKSAWTE